ncbi:MAG: hypothetical protein ACOWWM_06930 [Desulfobacterales bacterium]
MKSAADMHLTDRRIFEFLSERDRLPPTSEHDHLENCNHCRGRVDALDDDLRRLKQGAERFAPAPDRTLRLPEGLPGKSRRSGRFQAWKAGLGIAATFGILLLALIGIRPDRTPSMGVAPPPQAAVDDLEDPEMAEVHLLARNALPTSYLAITESIEQDPDEEEGFIDFLIPPLEDNSIS